MAASVDITKLSSLVMVELSYLAITFFTKVVFPHDVEPETGIVNGCWKIIVCCCWGSGTHGGALGGVGALGGALGGDRGGGVDEHSCSGPYLCCSSICLIIVYPLVNV